MNRQALDCREQGRRDAVRENPRWNGIDYVEVAADQMSLLVFFFGPPDIRWSAANFRIEGGRRITGIAVTKVGPGPIDEERGADALWLGLDRHGDFSSYTLRLIDEGRDAPPAGIDPRYAAIDFGFKVDCPGDLDCVSSAPCPPVAATPPDIDYLAKDYATFRQLLLDRLAQVVPGWRERHVPDLGVTLVELLAHAADQLSAYQDAVATEAYLETARTRISVRRHARLVDYRLHEGCNARAWLALACTQDTRLPRDACFVTAHPAIADVADGATCRAEALEQVPTQCYEVFEQAVPAGDDTLLVAAHSTLRFHTWGDGECCLPRGATRATLLDPGASQGQRLLPGTVLIFEEVLDPRTGVAADADPDHRQAVRLTEVHYGRDELLERDIIEIAWASADALSFPLCLSARLPSPDCRRIEEVSVARGNVILVDHGHWVRGEALGCVGSVTHAQPCGCDDAVADSDAHAAPFAPELKATPLVHRQPPVDDGPASTALAQDPRAARPALMLTAHMPGQAEVETWNAVADLLASDGDACAVVVEVDDDGRGRLRFGDDRCGRRPTPGACFQADYRIGDPLAGNVPREAIAHVVFRTTSIDGAGLQVRNPLAAAGGMAPESLANARLAAPHEFRNRLERAITADDYARLAARDPALQRANARLVWTGSWHEAVVALDPRGSEDADRALRRRVEQALECRRRAGHDLRVVPARYVPLAITLQVCVAADHLAAHVAAAVRDAFTSGLRTDGTPGFLHPDRLSFGTDVYASDLIAAAQPLDGVQSVALLQLRRLDRPAPDGPPPEMLDLATWEIARVDNDPSFPENGTFELVVGGGR